MKASSMPIHDWSSLDEDARERLLQRPAAETDHQVQQRVRDILQDVRTRGDAALIELTLQLDGTALDAIRVDETEFHEADKALTPSAIAAIELSIDTVRRFHEQQKPQALTLETMPGVLCERLPRPIDAVGLYVPAGTAPLPSTAVMLSVPAAIAGCPRRVLCTPPRADGKADPAVLAAARRGGVTEAYKIGGAQAIAAMAYGTQSLPKVDKLFGPGNVWVTTAKTLVATEPQGPAIDLPAGPSEVLVIADAAADPTFVAADLLSQAEHGGDSQVMLITTDAGLANAVAGRIAVRLPELSRRAIAAEAMRSSRIVVVADLAEAAEICNRYAPEHLILQIRNPRSLLPAIRNAGSVFLGPWSPESAGDYCSGTNHVLPTNGRARSYSGLGVDQFMRQMTVQELSETGLRSLSAAIIELATLEGLDAHAKAVSVRLGSPATVESAT